MEAAAIPRPCGDSRAEMNSKPSERPEDPTGLAEEDSALHGVAPERLERIFFLNLFPCKAGYHPPPALPAN